MIKKRKLLQAIENLENQVERLSKAHNKGAEIIRLLLKHLNLEVKNEDYVVEHPMRGKVVATRQVLVPTNERLKIRAEFSPLFGSVGDGSPCCENPKPKRKRKKK
jgi:hypothetical protein